jgi:hypothetical protein
MLNQRGERRFTVLSSIATTAPSGRDVIPLVRLPTLLVRLPWETARPSARSAPSLEGGGSECRRLKLAS